MNLKKDYKKPQDTFFPFSSSLNGKNYVFNESVDWWALLSVLNIIIDQRRLKHIKNIKNHQKFDLKQGVRYPYINICICIYMRCWILHLLLRFCVYLKFSLYYVFIHILNDPKLRKLIIGESQYTLLLFQRQ